MEITVILLVSLCSCVFSVILSQYKPEFSLLIHLATVLFIVLCLVSSVSEIFSYVIDIADKSKINKEYILLIIKAVVIAVAAKVVCDVCNETGNKSVAVCIELTAQVSIIMLSLPLMSALYGLTKDLIE